MIWDIGCSRNIFSSLRDKSKVFHVRLHHELKKYSYAVLEEQNFPNLDNLDVESQISEFKWAIHNGLRRTTITSRSDKQESSISQHRWNGYQWSFLTKIDLKKEEYKNLVDHLPTLLSNIENYKKTCIILDETTRELMNIIILVNIFNCYGRLLSLFHTNKKRKNCFLAAGKI